MTKQEPSLFVNLEQVCKLVGPLVGGGSLWDSRFETGFFLSYWNGIFLLPLCLMHNNHSM
jgi:hypothetical protein